MNRFTPKRSSLWLALTALLLTNNLYSQNPDIFQGYYHSAQGDSLSGQLNLGDLKHNVFKFRREKTSRWVVLSPKDIQKAVVETGVQIFPQEIRSAETSEQIFVKTLVLGDYTLFRGHTTSGSALFFAGLPGNKSLVKINPFGFESQLKLLLGSCGQQVKFNNMRYDAKSLSRYFLLVNQCVNPGKKTEKIAQKGKPRFGIGLSASYSRLAPKVDENNYFPVKDYKTGKLGGGISARLWISRTLTVHAGLNFVDKRVTRDSVVERLAYTKDVPGIPPAKTANYYRFAPDLNFKYLEVPVGMTWHFLSYSKISPSFTFGFTYQIPVVSKIENDWGYPICPNGPCDLPPGEIGHISPTWVEVDNKTLIHFFGGLGLRNTLKNQNEIELRLDYYSQSERAMVGTNKIAPQILGLSMQTHRLQLSFNYYFYFKKRTK